IWQTVWLETLPASHINGLRITPDLEEGAVNFEVAGNGDVKLTVTLDGDVVGGWSGAAGRGRIELETVAPWHPDSPTLYDVEASLLDGDGKVVDRILSYFGLRSVATSGGRVWQSGGWRPSGPRSCDVTATIRAWSRGCRPTRALAWSTSSRRSGPGSWSGCTT